MPDGGARPIWGAVAISIAAVLWGFDGVVLTPRLSRLNIVLVVFLLHAVPFLLMQPFLFRSYGAIARLSARGFAALTAVSVCGGLLGTFSIVRALFAVDFNGLSVVVLLQKLQPVFAILLAALLLGERLRRGFLRRAAVALIGAYLLSFGFGVPQIDRDRGALEGSLWALLAAASFGGSTVFGKKLLEHLDFKRAVFARYGLTALLAGGYLAGTGGLGLGRIAPREWLIIGIISLTTGSGALFLYYSGLAKVRAVTAAICELWLPLSAVAFDLVINGSSLSAGQWFGGTLLLAAITLESVEG